jgi:hypothetical protein
MTFRRVRVVLGGLQALAFTACTGIGSFDGPSDRPSGLRVLSGELVAPKDGVLAPRDTVGLQFALLEINTSSGAESGLRAVYTSAVFDPSADPSRTTHFAIAAPISRTFALVLQIPRGSPGGLGRFGAHVRFESREGGELTDVLFGAAQDIDLGVLEIERGPNIVGQDGISRPGLPRVRLGAGESKNPLRVNDVDGDGLPDYEDPDTDGDFLPNELDGDADGDGTLDVFQSLGALSDEEGSGVPDLMER